MIFDELRDIQSYSKTILIEIGKTQIPHSHIRAGRPSEIFVSLPMDRDF